MTHESHRRIHKILKENHPKAVRKAKRIFSFKFFKILLFLVVIALAYFIFRQPAVQDVILNLNKFSYLGFFIAGFLFVFGFSAPFSIGFFVIAQPSNIILATIIGGLGAVIGDVILFKTVQFSFAEEFKELKRKKIVKKIEKIINKNKHVIVRHYLLYIFLGLMIVAPVSDELGISILAGLTTIKISTLIAIGLIAQSVAIFTILYSV
jgi:uncharacterized membrane protein YdjX (TVP38/TMEM64 family)